MSNANKPVIFISSALSPNDDQTKVLDFFVIMAARLSVELIKNEHELILKVPKSQRTAVSDQIKFMEDLTKKTDLSEHYKGIIISPFKTDETEKALSGLMAEHGHKMPILTIDKKYDNNGASQLKRFSNAPVPLSVTCNSTYGGQLAAKSIIDYFNDNEIQFVEIVIVEGIQGSPERMHGFLNEIENFRNNNRDYSVRIHLILRGEFDRGVAKSAFKDKYEEIRTLGINAVFCCNDEMALGVRDFLFAKKESLVIKHKNIFTEAQKTRKQLNKKMNAGVDSDTDLIILKSSESDLEAIAAEIAWIKKIKIVGFDGIQEVRVHIDNNDRWLLNSVDVQVDRQVLEVVKLLKKSSSCLQTIQPKLVKEIEL